MAMPEATPEHTSRTGRRRPFTTWVKKLTHFKGGASSDGQTPGSKRHLTPIKIAPKKRTANKNNPYPLSGYRPTTNGGSGSGSNSNDHNHNDGGSSSNAQADSQMSYTTSADRSRRSHSSVQTASDNDGTDNNGGRGSEDEGSRNRNRNRNRNRIRIRSGHNGSSDDDIDDDDSDSRAPPTAGARSMAPTVSTEHDGPRSMLAPSNGAASTVTGTTSRTLNGGHGSSRRGGDSTFSSPAPSLQSLATTLTTIQSLQVPGGGGGHLHGGTSLGGGGGGGTGPTSSVGFGSALPLHAHHSSQQGSPPQMVLFHQPFPSTPASAIPSHLTAATTGSGGSATGHPTTYSTATANNLLTDNASILTLASSSKRRRRRSLDTDASVRALAPSSLFGGSRESLPLSVLSANIDGGGSGSGGGGGGGSSGGGGGSSSAQATTPGHPLHGSGSRMSVAAATERTSIYSTTGILGGDRSSYYARQSGGGGGAGAGAGNSAVVAGSGAQGGSGGSGGSGNDGASVRSGRSGRSGGSGFVGHGRSESIGGSIGGSMASPLASPLVSPLASPMAMPLASPQEAAEPVAATEPTSKQGSTLDADEEQGKANKDGAK